MKPNNRRTTVYLDAHLHRALQLKAIETSHSVSDLITDAVKYSLAEDAADYEAFAQRKNEPSLSFENVLKDLKKRGRI